MISRPFGLNANCTNWSASALVGEFLLSTRKRTVEQVVAGVDVLEARVPAFQYQDLQVPFVGAGDAGDRDGVAILLHRLFQRARGRIDMLAVELHVRVFEQMLAGCSRPPKSSLPGSAVPEADRRRRVAFSCGSCPDRDRATAAG